MKSIAVILLVALVALCSGSAKQVKHADKDFLVKQKFIFDILQHYHQHHVQHDQHYDAYKTYNIEENYNLYTNPEKVKDFVTFYHHHNLPDEEVFTIFNKYHERLAHGLIHTLYFAKDYETFAKTAVWAKHHLNRGVFLYAFHVATLARQDMQGIVFPAIYEINPYYFFTAETIQKAHHYKMQGFPGVKKVEDVYNVVIPSNYTGVYGHENYDNMLAYFTEDVGLNAFYYYYNIDYPFWTHGRDEAQLKKDYRGNFYLYLHWQILARYYMERLSHNLGEIEEFNWFEGTNAGYHSGLQYYNGFNFPSRDNNYHFYNRGNYYLIDVAQYYEERILESIDLGRWIKDDLTHVKFVPNVKENLENLGNIIQGNLDSYNQKYYGSIDAQLRNIINEAITYGKYEDDLPGALLHYETSMRDPIFYSLYKRLLRYHQRYIHHLPPYTDKDLGFEGVVVDNVEVDKLVTYYDKFDSDISNVVDVDQYTEGTASDLVKFGRISHHQGSCYVVKARQYRLNHLPFTVKVTVNSNKAQKAAVKFFIAPKYDHYGHKINLWNNRENFFELEHFIVDLTPGKNVITRNSDDFSWYVHDRTTYFELYKKLFTATNSDSYKFPLDMTEAHCGFPNRLMLPRGKKGGMPFQFFVYVGEYHEPKVPQFTGYDPVVSCGIGSGARFVDETPFGYPFDREIDSAYWHLTNMHYHDVTVYHKTEAEVNAPQHH